jgi:hypothetical protein
LKISELCRKFHLSYATVAHIVKFYRENLPPYQEINIKMEENRVKKEENNVKIEEP